MNDAVTIPVVVGRYRWRICALLFASTTINYVDRQVFGVLAPELQKTVGWSEVEYGYIVTSFQAAYAIGLLSVGGIIDKVGTRLGYALSIVLWSLAAMSHSLVSTVMGFGIVRFMLGLGEAGNFPAGIKTVAEWFPRKERAFATGIFNSGTNVGAILAPLIVPSIATRYGWQYAFLFTGLFSALWLVAWWTIYRPPAQHPQLGAAELAWIRSDPDEPTTRIPWRDLLKHRQTWAFLIGKFFTDPIWWMFLFWLPKFFSSKHNLKLTELGAPLIIIYVAADIGSIAGGWLASRLIQRGWTVNRARKAVMLGCAVAVTPVVFAANIEGVWSAVALIGLATAAHQGWSANLFTTASDMFPRRAVASVVGIGGFGGSVGGMLIANVVGFVLQMTGSYVSVFAIAASAYLIALGLMHLLVPRMEPALID